LFLPNERIFLSWRFKSKILIWMYYYLDEPCENSTSLPVPGGVSSAECFSDIPQFVLSRLNLIADKFCSRGSETESCHGSLSGMTCEPLMATHGEARSMSSAEDFPVKTSVSPEKVPGSMGSEADSGEKWRESFAKWDRDLSLWRTRQLWLFEDLEESLATWPRWGMMRSGECWERTMSNFPMHENDYGLWPTPTKMDAILANMMPKNGDTIRLDKYGKQRKVLADGRTASMGLCRLIISMTGKFPKVELFEELMAWPSGWTELQSLATDKFQQWLLSHSEPY
jgi:hypothetical protein